MKDPFAFMGIRRGSGRPDDPPYARRGKLRFITPDDQLITVACCNLLDELNTRSASLGPDVVANIASRHGFDCESPLPGVFTLRYSAQKLVAFLVQEPPAAVGNAPLFELFIGVTGVRLA